MTEATASPADPQAGEQSAWVTFRCTPAERDELKDHSHAARISTSELVRRRALGLAAPKAAVPQINAQTYRALGQIGHNLNQQTKLAHESRQLTATQLPQLVKVLTELNAVLKQVQREVIAADQQPEASE